MNSNISIRRATSADDESISRLAALDSARVPTGPVLIAEVADQPHAAIDIDTGAVIADPFRPTSHLAELLQLRARSIREPRLRPERRPVARNRGHVFRAV